MTPTAHELLNDINFIEKRIYEQRVYIWSLMTRLRFKQISRERFDLLVESAVVVKDRFKDRAQFLFPDEQF